LRKSFSAKAENACFGERTRASQATVTPARLVLAKSDRLVRGHAAQPTSRKLAGKDFSDPALDAGTRKVLKPFVEWAKAIA
jgi:hypothetical protein